jgi:PASTA domain
VSDLADAIRAHMLDGAEPITLEEIDERVASGRSPRRGAHSLRRTLWPPGPLRDPRDLRRPAIAWVGLVTLLVVAVVVGVTLSSGKAPSKTGPAGPGPSVPSSRTTAPSVSSVKVPNVTGLQLLSAASILKADGLGAPVVHPTACRNIPGGGVCSQSPAAGTTVAKGTSVTLSVSQVIPTTTPTSQAVPGIPVRSGVYVGGSPGSPYYFITVQVSGNSMTGDVDFLYQDGQTSAVFTFVGSIRGDTATLVPKAVANAVHSSVRKTLPPTITASLVMDAVAVIDLPDCASYLYFVTPQHQCSFELTTTGLGAVAPRPAAGTYDDGPVGTPHYALQILDGTGQSFHGILEYVSADGTSSWGFNFTALFEDAVAVLQPIPTAHETSPVDSVPSEISVTLGSGSLSLGECPYFLPKAQTMAQCTFTMPSSS